MSNIFDIDDGSNRIMKLPATVWGDNLYAKSFDGPRYILFRKQMLNRSKDESVNMAIWTLIYTMCDESGNMLFTEADYEKFQSRNPIVVNRLANWIADEQAVYGDFLEKKLNTSETTK